MYRINQTDQLLTAVSAIFGSIPVKTSASNEGYPKVRNHGEGPYSLLATRAFSWLKAAATAFTFKTLFRQYAKQVLTVNPHGK